ncbi:MAG: phage tail protein [Sporomusaceae bacterium]|nr:phage tail protein [Sporomusaceae bacterium]
MAMSPFTGWAVSTFLLWRLGKNNNGSSEQADAKPEELTAAETETGKPIPVVLGRGLIKNPLTSYFGDFRADIYTEEYAAHASFSAWPIILTGLLSWLLKPKTGDSVDSTTNGHSKDTHEHNLKVTGQASLTQVKSGEHAHDVKETEGPNFLMMLAQWLLSWLINGRNLKTTIQKGFKYYLGYQQVVCWSEPGMRLKAVYIGQEKVWEGDAAREDYQNGPLVIRVNNENLFGGVDEGGGFIGELHVYLGGDNQMPDPWMIKQMQADTIKQELRGLTPAYRDFVTVVVPTAYIGKSAKIPEMWYEVEFTPNRLGSAGIDGDANPAEAIYEMVVNENWGLSEAIDSMDQEALKAVATTFAAEKMGVTVKLETKETARTILDSLCDHLNMVRYNDPSTGKLTFKLIRDDYDPLKVLLLNEDNCEKVVFTRIDWRETIGEVAVTYTDRSAIYEQGNINDQDAANITINEGTKNDKSYSFLYFTSSGNALWAVQRELRQQGYPLAGFTITGNRKLSGLRTGDVARINWPAYSIENMLIRVTSVDLGDFAEGKVTIEALEDVFSLDKTDLDFNGSTDWQPELKHPTGVQDYSFIEMPYEIIPEKSSYVFAMAAKPDADTSLWKVWRKKDGGSFESTSSMTKWTAAARLVYDYLEFSPVEDLVGIEVVDIYGLEWLHDDTPISGSPDLTAARKGSKVIILGDEILAWSGIKQMANGHWKITGILRGTHDTVPRFHSAGEIMYFLESGTYANVTTGGAVVNAGQTVVEEYNITTATAYFEEEFSDAKIKVVETVRRPERPNAPGRFRMSDFGAQNRYFSNEAVGDMTFDWIARNKEFSFGCVSQDDQKEYFTQQPFKPIDDLEYLIKVYVGGVWVNDYTTTATSWQYTWEQRCLDSSNVLDKTRIEVYSRLNGLTSYQPQVRSWQWQAPVMVNACESEDAAYRQLLMWDTDDRVVVPVGPLCDVERQFMHYDMPVMLLGTPCGRSMPGAVACWDGSYILPNGKMMIITEKWGWKTIDLPVGYTIYSWWVPEASGGRVYYRWNGAGMDRTLAE